MNKKIIIIAVSIAAVLVCGVLFKMKSYSYKDALKDAKNTKSYEFVCQMDMMENDELKTYQVTSVYARIDNKDYYKVELYDKSLNMAQVIVRNNEGVFVLTPELNQVFQFKSDWPSQSPKPYIYQSLISFLEENKYEKIKDGYQVMGDIQYENDSRIKSQEVIFDKKLYPVNVYLYDQDGGEVVKCTMTSFKTNNEIKEDVFKVENLMSCNEQVSNEVASLLPLYPVSLMGSVLEKEEVSSIDESLNHILKFTGDKTFTIVQSPLNVSKEVTVTKIEHDMIDFIDGVGYENHDAMTLMTSGIICSIYSNDLSYNEKLSVLSSMQVSTMK